MIVIMAGLPGTGKSTLARAVAQKTGAIVLDKDVIRAAMFPGDTIDYTTEQDDVCVNAMFLAAEYLLRRDPSRTVIVDGRPFVLNSQLRTVTNFAERIHAEWKLIECVCSEQTAKSRLNATDNTHPAANRNWRLYESLRAQYEPKSAPKTTINTDADLETCVEQVLDALREKTGSTW